MAPLEKLTPNQWAWYVWALGTGTILGAIFRAWLPLSAVGLCGLIVMFYGHYLVTRTNERLSRNDALTDLMTDGTSRPTRQQWAWYVRALGAGAVLGALLTSWLPFVVVNFFGMLVMIYGKHRVDVTKNQLIPGS